MMLLVVQTARELVFPSRPDEDVATDGLSWMTIVFPPSIHYGS